MSSKSKIVLFPTPTDLPDPTLLPKSIQVDHHELWTSYTGTRDALVAVRLATPGMFPEGRKRVKDNLAPGLKLENTWRVDYVKGGKFRLTRWHERGRTPASRRRFNPKVFRLELALFGIKFLDTIVARARGDYEREQYGTPIHKLSDGDIQQITRLRNQLLTIIQGAKIEGEPKRPSSVN